MCEALGIQRPQRQTDRIKREAAKVLREAFQEGRLTADPMLDDLLRGDSDAVQAYKMLQALVKLARNQILLESQLHTHTTQIADHDERLENIEMTLGDTGRLVTPDQASQISQAVKAVALVLTKQSGSNQYGITGYKMLPAAKFQGRQRAAAPVELSHHGQVLNGS
jgi:hypothetical protein